MKPVLLLVVCFFLGGCVHYHNAAPKGDITPAPVSSVSDFAGVYSNSGLGESSTSVSLAGFLLRYHNNRMDRGGQVRLIFSDGVTLEIEARQGDLVLKRGVMRLGEDYIFRGGKIVFESYSEAGRSHNEAFPSVASRGHRRVMWLTRNGDLVAEEVYRASGVAMGFIPGAGYSRDAWKWTRVKNEP